MKKINKHNRLKHLRDNFFINLNESKYLNISINYISILLNYEHHEVFSGLFHLKSNKPSK